jgi:threonine synthase
MRFVSTRPESPAVPLAQAIRCGAAPGGGLYVPAEAVRVELDAIGVDASLASAAAAILAPFFAGDPLAPHLNAICAEAFDFPAPLVPFDAARPGLSVIELFHGPTGAFKDFGARFLMACFDRLSDPEQPATVLVATSGDTGGAIACAAEGRRGVRSVVLYPPDRVSSFQRLQLSCWAAPNLSLEVEGDFDGCQRLVKTAFAHAGLSARHRLTPGNSINVGRMLAQMTYVGFAALKAWRESGVAPGFVIPSGNLGHAVAALWAREAGLPVGPVVIATNANRTLLEWSRTDLYRPVPSLQTLASAMDVGAPSNFERLVRAPNLKSQLHVERVDDEAIRRRIRQEFRRDGHVLCPHSAVAVEAYRRLDPAVQGERPWIVAATAHPYKFADVVEPLIGETLRPPPGLAAILGRRRRAQPIPATLDALAAALDAGADGASEDNRMEEAA